MSHVKLLTALLFVAIGLSVTSASIAARPLGHGQHRWRVGAHRHRCHSARRCRGHRRRRAGATPASAGRAIPSPPPAPISGTTYYVSPSGSDSNSGTSPEQAWRTVHQANRADLQPGDAILFQGGATFADDPLEPGWGTAVSGTGVQPVVFGSYGEGQASLPNGIWTKGESNLVFENFNLGPAGDLSGTGNDITVEGCSISNILTNAEYGIVVTGSNWLIRDNWINHTGDSGMLLTGDHFRVQDNAITDTGVDPAITWGDHGIYLDASNSTIRGNIISGFHNDGVSVRYRDSVVSDNQISNGQIGIAWFQYDPQAGTSYWTSNSISNTRLAGIYISPGDIAGSTRETFIIRSNRITEGNAHPAGWEAMNLRPTSGTYAVSSNSVR